MCAFSDRQLTSVSVLSFALLACTSTVANPNPIPSPLSSLSYAPHMLLFFFGVRCCSSMKFVMLFEKLHFKQQKNHISMLCSFTYISVPPISYAYLFDDYLGVSPSSYSWSK